MDISNLKINLKNRILRTDKTIILPHKYADFDAIGSALGLSLVASNFNKEAKIIMDDKKYEIDRAIKYIIDDMKNEFEIINSCKYKKIISNNDLYVLTDVNQIDRIPIGNLITRKKNTMIIDHHDENEKTIDAKYKYIDSNISSTSEIITQLLYMLKIQIPNKIATYLLAGIHLDTNHLTRNIDENTFKTADILIKSGASTEVVTDLFKEDAKSEKRIKGLSEKTKLLTYKIALIIADNKDEYTTKELAKTANNALEKGVDASFAIARISDEIIGISARSNDTFDVGKIMAELGGGGNRNSAATRIECSDVEDVSNRLRKIIKPKYYVDKEE